MALPSVRDPALRVELFAQEPLIKHPIGMTVDVEGRLLVIESHTHFRRPNYVGPVHDRILWLQDTDGDHRADAAIVFFEGSDLTMDIATAPDGSIYVATRDEVLRLRDVNHDGKADQVDRKLVFFETENRYPHDGLSGLAFDRKGGLYFGMGSNMGAAYTLLGSDGSRISDQGEGGNIFHVNLEGGEVRRVATGFWNPFGVCVDGSGNVFATDNDPDSRPPCRLQLIIEGGDYGYQFRYGRSGLHPFISWNGELPGTLPMFAATGEAPGMITWYQPGADGRPKAASGRGANAGDFVPLTRQYGKLLLTSWSDHTVESYQPNLGTAPGKREVLVQGGVDFRPVGLAVAQDGALFVSDWVKRDYWLHGFGRVWRVAAKAAQPRPEPHRAVTSAAPGVVERLECAAPDMKTAVAWLGAAGSFEQAWLFSASITRLSREPKLLEELSRVPLQHARQRQGFMLAVRKSNVPFKNSVLRAALADTDATTRLLALKWLSDERLPAFRGEVERLLTDPGNTPALFYGALTALSRLDSEKLREPDFVKRLKQHLADHDTPPRLKRMALEILPNRARNVLARELEPLLAEGDDAFKEWVTQVLGELQDENRVAALRRVAFDNRQASIVRAAALMHLPVNAEDQVALKGIESDGDPVLARAVRFAGPDRIGPNVPSGRPPAADIAAWEKYLQQVPGKADLVRGREVFLHPRRGSCATCHRVDGLGNAAGPNLSAIGSVRTPTYILESLLQPNLNVAPEFESLLLETTDGQTRMVFQLLEGNNAHTYVGLDATPFVVKSGDIVRREVVPVSIMPEGLVAGLSDEEVRDLVAFLRSQK